MRLIQVLHGWPPESMGGTGLYVHALSLALQQAGHDIHCVAPGGPGLRVRAAAHDGIKGHLIHGRPALTWRGAWTQRGTQRRWTKLLTKLQPDIVHIHHLSGLPIGLAEATRNAGVPLAMTLHDYWLPCHRGQLITSTGTPCDGPTPTGCAQCIDAPQTRRRVADAQARIDAAKAALQAADVLWSPSHDLAERMTRMGLRTPEHCPLPLVRPMPTPAAATSGPVRFLFASSLIPTKGAHILLKAFRRLPVDAQLTLAGPTPAYDRSQTYAKDLLHQAAGDPRVQWLGHVPPEEMPALLARHDVLVLPSLWPENSPLIVREATACGLSIIGSTVGGTRELAPDANLVTPGDTDGLLAALQAAALRGRHRQPPTHWQTPAEHAAWLLARYPRRDVARRGD